MNRPLEDLEIPEFKEFVRVPNNPTCPVIDSTRLMVEILWWLERSELEFDHSTLSSKITLWWAISLVLRYKYEKDRQYRPVCVISFDARNGGIHIRQMQWSNDKKVSYRFHASFDTVWYYLKLLEQSFIRKWIPITFENQSEWLERGSHASQAEGRYKLLKESVQALSSEI